MKLLNEVRYTDPNGIVWIAPSGWVVDGASIPQVFWSFIGGPFEGKYRYASVLHDVACDQKSRGWTDADLMFYNAMRCSGVPRAKAKTMYLAVYHFGPHWNLPNPAAKLFGASASPIEALQARPGARPSPPKSKAEVNAIYKKIRAEDPDLSKLQDPNYLGKQKP
jgi:hypothetical protein